MIQSATAPVKHAGRSYLIEFTGAMALYVGAVVARPWLVGHAANPALAFLATLLPVVPIWLLLAACWRHYRRIDEYARHKFLVTLAISFGVGSALIMSYAILTDAGLPPLAITWAWPTLATTWAVASAILSIEDRT